MTVQLNFNAQTVEPQQSLEAVPAGEYTVILTESEPKETSSGGNHMLKCTFEITEGDCKGRKVFENMNLWHSNAVASEIAWRKLSALCHAAGVLQVQDTGQLHNIPVTAVVKVENDPEYGKQNRITSFKAAGGAAQAGPAQAPAAAPQQPAPQQAPNQAPAPQQAPPQQPQQAPAQQQPQQTPPADAGNAPPWMQQQQGEQPQGSGPGQPPPWAR